MNVSIRDLAAGSESAPVEWEFFCECGDADCHEQVLLTLESYGAIHDQPEPVDLNLPGYSLDTRAALAAMSPDAPTVASLREALA